MKATMTNNDVYRAINILNFLNIRDGDKVLPPKAAAELTLVKGSYKRALESFQSVMNDVLQGLKKEGYDKREADADWYNNEYQKKVEAKEKITPEEKKRALAVKATLPAFEKERADYIAAQNEAYERCSKDEVEIPHAQMSSETYTAICETYGFEGEVKIEYELNGEKFANKASRHALMLDVAAYLVG